MRAASCARRDSTFSSSSGRSFLRPNGEPDLPSPTIFRRFRRGAFSDYGSRHGPRGARPAD